MLFRIALAFAALLCAELASSPSDASLLYVAGSGIGSVCSFTSPCSNIATALAGAGPGDTIVCLSPPFQTNLLITKSVTIDCSGARAWVRDIGVGAAITINVLGSPSDLLRTVRLRGMTVDGLLPNGPRIYEQGIDIQSAAAIYIEDCIIANVKQQGILDHRIGGPTKLFIKDTIVSGNGGTGIGIVSQGPTTTVLDNVNSENNAYGIAVANGNDVLISRSVFSGNSVAGIEGDSGAQIVVDGSSISHNNIGVQSVSSVRLSNNNIAFNNSAISGSSGTFGNNRFSGNGTIGTAPTPLGGASSDLGQQ